MALDGANRGIGTCSAPIGLASWCGPGLWPAPRPAGCRVPHVGHPGAQALGGGTLHQEGDEAPYRGGAQRFDGLGHAAVDLGQGQWRAEPRLEPGHDRRQFGGGRVGTVLARVLADVPW